MRSSTIRFASAASAARRTLIPLASSAAAVRFTPASSAGVANRVLTDRSSSLRAIDAPFSTLVRCYILASATTNVRPLLLHMQIHSTKPQVTGLLDRLVADA